MADAAVEDFDELNEQDDDYVNDEMEDEVRTNFILSPSALSVQSSFGICPLLFLMT